MYRRCHLAGTAAAGVGQCHTPQVRAGQVQEWVAGGCTESEWLQEFPEVRNKEPSETRSTTAADQLPVYVSPAPLALASSVLAYGRSATRGL